MESLHLNDWDVPAKGLVSTPRLPKVVCPRVIH
jgi:hypothetical protein